MYVFGDGGSVHNAAGQFHASGNNVSDQHYRSEEEHFWFHISANNSIHWSLAVQLRRHDLSSGPSFLNLFISSEVT